MYAYADINEAVYKCKPENNTEEADTPNGVIGVVLGYLNKMSSSEGKQGCKISLGPWACKLVGRLAQTSLPMPWSLRNPEEDKLAMRLNP